MSAPDWRFYSLDAMTLTVRDELPLGNVTMTDRLKAPGSMSAGLAQFHPAATPQNLDTENTIICATRDGRIMWAGPLVEWSRSEGAKEISLRCEGQWRALRLIDLRSAAGMTWGQLRTVDNEVRWEQTDQFRIVDDLIAHANATPGTATHTAVEYPVLSGQLRDRSYDLTGRMIGGLIEQLSDVQGGFDWSLEPNGGGVDSLGWRLRLFHPRRARHTQYEWSLDSHGGNILDYSFTESSSGQIGRMIGVGAGEGADQLIATRDDAALLGSVPLRARSGSWTDVSQPATLQAHVDRELARNRRATRIPRLITDPAREPRLSTYALGDVVRVRISDGPVDLDDHYRIISREIRLTADGGETVAVEVEPLMRGS